jgi:hypothetical protein
LFVFDLESMLRSDSRKSPFSTASTQSSPRADCHSRIGIYGPLPDLSKFHQVLCDEHLAGKVLLNFLNMADVIIVEMRQYHRLDIGARRQFSNFVGQQVLLDVVSK